MVDVTRHLLRGLDGCAGEPLAIEAAETRPWASVTFSGQIVTVTIASSPAAERLCQRVADHEFAIPGHIVADVAIPDRSAAPLRIEALVIEAV